MASVLKLDTLQHTTGNVAATITSAGYINYPEKPIIAGRIGSSATLTVPGLIPFDEFFISRGITYNSSTRRFTVPVTGIYRITMDIFWNTGVSGGRVLVGKNTDTPTQSSPSTYLGHAYHGGTVYEGGSINSVAQLAANDYIVYYMASNGIYNATGDRFNTFSIELIA